MRYINLHLHYITLHRSAYASHITRCIHQRQFFHLVFLSHALSAHLTVYKRERWTHSKCFVDILQHIFYHESMTSVLYSFWQADDHQICWDVWEQSNWASVRRQLSSYLVTLTGRDAEWLPTHNSRYPPAPPDLHQSSTHSTQRPPTVRSCTASVNSAKLTQPRRRITYCIISRLTSN